MNKIVHIHGNCQASAIAKLLSEVMPSRYLTYSEVHLLDVENRQLIEEQIYNADIIFSQPISREYRNADWLSLDAIQKNRRPESILRTFPVVFFRGYHPSLFSLSQLPDYPIAYHDANAIELFLQDKNFEEYVDQIYKEDYYSDDFSLAECFLTIKELLRREYESGTDVAASDIIIDQFQRSNCFYTSNHPSRSVLARITNRLLQSAGESTRISLTGNEPLDQVIIPPYRSTVINLGLHAPSFDVQRTKPRFSWKSSDAFARETFEYYKAVGKDHLRRAVDDNRNVQDYWQRHAKSQNRFVSDNSAGDLVKTLFQIFLQREPSDLDVAQHLIRAKEIGWSRTIRQFLEEPEFLQNGYLGFSVRYFPNDQSGNRTAPGVGSHTPAQNNGSDGISADPVETRRERNESSHDRTGDQHQVAERAKTGATVIDVGANSGGFCLEVARRTDARVIAIEPIPSLIAHMTSQIQSESLDVQIIDCAISVNEGIQNFHVAAHADQGVSSLYDFNKNIDQESYWETRTDLYHEETIQVKTCSMRTVVQDNNIDCIDYVKIDTQGADLEVLRSFGDFIHLIRAGCIEVASSDHTSLYNGTRNTLAEALRFLEESNFEVWRVRQNDPGGNEVNISFYRRGESYSEIESSLCLPGIEVYDGHNFWHYPSSDPSPPDLVPKSDHIKLHDHATKLHEQATFLDQRLNTTVFELRKVRALLDDAAREREKMSGLMHQLESERLSLKQALSVAEGRQHILISDVMDLRVKLNSVRQKNRQIARDRERLISRFLSE